MGLELLSRDAAVTFDGEALENFAAGRFGVSNRLGYSMEDLQRAAASRRTWPHNADMSLQSCSHVSKKTSVYEAMVYLRHWLGHAGASAVDAGRVGSMCWRRSGRGKSRRSSTSRLHGGVSPKPGAISGSAPASRRIPSYTDASAEEASATSAVTCRRTGLNIESSRLNRMSGLVCALR